MTTGSAVVLGPSGGGIGSIDAFDDRTITTKWGAASGVAYSWDNGAVQAMTGLDVGVNPTDHGWIRYFDPGDGFGGPAGSYGGAGFGVWLPSVSSPPVISGWAAAHTGMVIQRIEAVPQSISGQYSNALDVQIPLPFGTFEVWWDAEPASGAGYGQYTIPRGDISNLTTDGCPFLANEDLIFEWQYDGTTTHGYRCRLYQGSAPSTWDYEGTWTPFNPTAADLFNPNVVAQAHWTQYSGALMAAPGIRWHMIQYEGRKGSGAGPIASGGMGG